MAAAAIDASTAPRPPPLDTTGPAPTVAVVPARSAPESGFGGRPAGETLARGAAVGAGVGAIGGALLLGVGAAVFPPLGVPLGLAMAPFMVGGGAIAGAGGAAARGTATVVPEELRATLDQALAGVLSDLPPQDLTASTVARSMATFTPVRAEVVPGLRSLSGDYTADVRALRERGYTDALETNVTRIGFAGWKAEGLFLFVTAEARLYDTATGKVKWLRGMVYESRSHSSTLWLRDDAARMRAEIKRAYLTLAERIVDLAALVTEPAASAESGPNPDTCGMAPLEPGPILETAPAYGQYVTGSTLGAGAPVLARSGSLTPVLAWAALPVPTVPFAGNPWARANDVRYDLRIWSAADDSPVDIAYERFGLTGTRHQVEVALEPATTYFWSVRMRGTIDGHWRATSWSASIQPTVIGKPFLANARFCDSVSGETVTRAPCRIAWPWCRSPDFIPSENYFRFRTP